MNSYRLRRMLAFLVVVIAVALPLSTTSIEDMPTLRELVSPATGVDDIVAPELKVLNVKGRAPKTGYERAKFGSGWDSTLGCDTRNRILARDLKEVVRAEDGCKIVSGILDDPYTGQSMRFVRGPDTSDDIQIDHVVALSNAWQTGAQQMSASERISFSNDPLNLLAVSGPANEQKSDGDAATWLPSHKPFRCQYVSRQIAVKQKYGLWVTPSERTAMQRILESC
jgi:hypothetical protein